MLENIDAWVRGTSKKEVAWVHGHAGSGKSALLNSIARNLEDAHTPFTVFRCKRDDPELSNIHRILPTICYDITQFYDNYHGIISTIVDQPEGRTISTGDISRQGELLFGKMFELISPERAFRPPIHVILIDALDECRNHRDDGKTTYERRALLRFLLNLANAVPWIKVLITGRPEPDIVSVFEKTTYVVHLRPSPFSFGNKMSAIAMADNG